MMRDLFSNPIPDPANTHISFRQWQIREGNVLYHSGTKPMSTTHLLAHLLRNHETASRLMEHFRNLSAIAEASIPELMQVKGVGKATAEAIQVAFELSRKLTQTNNEVRRTVHSPNDIYRLIKADFSRLKQEVLLVLLLNTKNIVEHIHTVFVGTLNCSLTHPREIFKTAIKHSAASVILAHNHPSGSCDPSSEDIHATKQLVKVGELVQIPVLDHIIVGDGDYLSMKELGLL